ncbi:imidazoleglycerol-phosphate dehydratase HisB [bacterium]|jgi:imidazoleglycerol-phosphate dehydratase|nr:imidazoleglycerol-phosphate dehydratase HisB [bacterium]
MSTRQASISRDTKETQIQLDFTVDGDCKSDIKTGIGFLDHMLDLFTVHGLFDLKLRVNGDLEIDGHHTTEDVAICLGKALSEALNDSKGIHRYASGLIPMDEALCQIALDISGRPHLDFEGDFPKGKVGDFDVELVEEFFRAFVNNARVTLHINVLKGGNLHHMIEACFKAFGVILDRATQIDTRKKGVPSTKGVL